MIDERLIWFRTVLMAAVGGIVALLGGWDAVLEVLVTLMVLDYVCGVGQAVLDHRLSSAVGFKGILKKAGYLMLVMVACLFDRAMQFQEPLSRTVILLFLIANESLSILEHLAIFGVPVPKWLLERLQKLQEQHDTSPGSRPG